MASSIKNIYILKKKNELKDAVDACRTAAAHEFDTSIQLQLLKAAAYGKTFDESYEHNSFVRVCKLVRVLNQVREEHIGIPLTYKQIMVLSPKVLVDRLVNRHHHVIAYEICKYLDLEKEKVLIHWACTKVRSNQQDEDREEILQSIVSKLRRCKTVSYVEVAATAYKSGKVDLALDLLQYDTRPALQVPLLLEMREDNQALQKAIESGDTDLVYHVLLHIKKNANTVQFFKIIQSQHIAKSLLITYCKEQDVEFLKKYYNALNKHHDAGSLAVLESYKEHLDDWDERLYDLKVAKDFFSKNKVNAVDTKATDDQIKLLKIQRDTEARTGSDAFVNTSISDTIYRLMLLADVKKKHNFLFTFLFFHIHKMYLSLLKYYISTNVLRNSNLNLKCLTKGSGG